MRKQPLRRGTAAYNLAKAQGRLPAKSKSTKKKTGNPLSRLMGALTGKSKPKKTFVPKKTRGQGTKKPKATTKTTTPGKNVSGGTRENRAIGLGASNDRTIYDAGELPPITIKLRRVNKAPNTPGSRQSGRGRTYTRSTIG